jgi:hypothetical protein
VNNNGATKTVVAQVTCADGKRRNIVELAKDADGSLTMLDSRGRVWTRDAVQHERMYVQDAERATRWHVFDVETGDYLGSTRIFDDAGLAAQCEAAANAARPQTYKAWTWTAGKPLMSLAEFRASLNKRFNSLQGDPNRPIW